MLTVLKYPDPRLKDVAEPVEKFGPELHKLLDEMAETMYAENGVGLAGPQVGQSLRVFVIDIGSQSDDSQHKRIYEFINPKITSGEGKIYFEEGCLSVPGITEEVQRKAKIKVDYQDRQGKAHTLEAEGLLAVAIQHENDHLDGVLFVDRLSPIRRRLVKRKLAKAVTL